MIASLRAGAPIRWTVRGASMWPAIPDGSEVEVTPCAADALRAGEVAAYARGDTVVVHRFVGWREGALRFQGDSLLREDAPVPPGDVLGRASVRRRAKVGWTWPRRTRMLGATRAALAWLRSLAQPSGPR
ncbi:MAG: S24/S26 family peptidase [Polyangiales bacterium]